MALRLILPMVSGLLAVWLGWMALGPEASVAAFVRLGYAAIAITSVWFAWRFAATVPWRVLARRFRAGGWRVCLMVTVVSGVLHLESDHSYKVVLDEIILSGTSQGMHRERRPVFVERGLATPAGFEILATRVDKRPVFFPFLLSVVHDATGYRPENAFWLNGLLTPVFLGLLYLVVRRLAGVAGGVAAVLAWATIPLFTQVATGAGFELLNLTMIAAVIWLGMRYAEAPDDRRLMAFVLAGVLLAQVRYESALLLAPTGLAVLWMWRRRGWPPLPWELAAIPLSLVPLAWQHQVFTLNPDLWQMKDQASEHGVFSLFYLPGNIGHALNYFLTFDFSQPSSLLAGLLGVVGAALMPVWLLRRRREPSLDAPRTIAVLFVGGLGLLGCLILGYFWGQMDNWVTTRLSLPLQFGGLLVFFLVAGDVLGVGRRAWRTLAGVAVAVMAFWTFPALSEGRFRSEATTPLVANWTADFIRSHDLAGALVIDPRLVYLWFLHEVSATSTDAVMARPDRLLFHWGQGTFQEILVVRRLERETGTDGGGWRVNPHDDLGAGVGLEVLAERSFGPFLRVQILRVRSVDAKKFGKDAADYIGQRKDLETNQAAAFTPQRWLWRETWRAHLP